MLLYIQRNFLRREIRKRNIQFSWVQTTRSSKSNRNNKSTTHYSFQQCHVPKHQATYMKEVNTNNSRRFPLYFYISQQDLTQDDIFISQQDPHRRDVRSNTGSPKVYFQISACHFLGCSWHCNVETKKIEIRAVLFLFFFFPRCFLMTTEKQCH